jgi:DNA-binding MarR family transcriptional regulator
MEPRIVFEETVSYRLSRVSTYFRNALERQIANTGLHAGQVFILFELWHEDGLRQVDLANRLGLAAPTVSKMLKGLEEINLITRSRFGDDGRSFGVFLTEQGINIRPAVEEQWQEVESACLAGLKESERVVLTDILGQLHSLYSGRDLDNEG